MQHNESHLGIKLIKFKQNSVIKFLLMHWIHFVGLLFAIRCVILILNPMLWAEDATVFYGPLINSNQPLQEILTQNSNAQFFVFNFLVAKIALALTFDDLNFLPLTSTILSLLFTVLSASLWLKARLIFPKLFHRQLIFSFILMAPSGNEPLGNVTNLHSYLLLGSIAIAGWEYQRNKSNIVIFTIVGLNLFTSINAVFILVAYLFHCVANSKRRVFVPLFIALCIGFQSVFWSSRVGSQDQETVQREFWIAIFTFLKRIGAETIVGQNFGLLLDSRVGNVTWIFLGCLVSTLMLFLINQNRKVFSSDLSLVYLLAIFCVYMMMVWISSRSIGVREMTSFGAAGRYLMVLHCLFFAIFIKTLTDNSKQRNGAFKFASLAMALFFGLGIVSDFKIANESTPLSRSSWTKFSDCVNTGVQECNGFVPPGPNWVISIIRE